MKIHTVQCHSCLFKCQACQIHLAWLLENQCKTAANRKQYVGHYISQWSKSNLFIWFWLSILYELRKLGFIQQIKPGLSAICKWVSELDADKIQCYEDLEREFYNNKSFFLPLPHPLSDCSSPVIPVLQLSQ